MAHSLQYWDVELMMGRGVSKSNQGGRYTTVVLNGGDGDLITVLPYLELCR